MKILADQNMIAVEDRFADLGTVELLPGREISSEHLRDADVLLVRSVTEVNAELLEGSSVHFVGSATSGFDHVDREFLKSANIGFSHAPGSNANSVVEYVLSVICHDNDRLERLFDGASLGIVGYGHVGQLLATRLEALGIDWLAFDPWLDKAISPRLADLEDVLACDVVSIHAELTDKAPWPSRHLLNHDRLRELPKGALLINCGRGPLIDSRALLALLETRDDLRIALDVWEFEPEVDPNLMDRCFIATPHIAGYSSDGKYRATQMLYAPCCAHLGLAAGPDKSPMEALEVTEIKGSEPADILRYLLSQVYDVRVDDSRMRRELDQGFDYLRKTYPVRRELAGSVFSNALSAPQSTRRLLQALGCHPV